MPAASSGSRSRREAGQFRAHAWRRRPLRKAAAAPGTSAGHQRDRRGPTTCPVLQGDAPAAESGGGRTSPPLSKEGGNYTQWRVMRRGFASAHLAAGSRRFGRVADWCALLRIVSWLPLWVRSCEALPSTLNGGGFHRVRSWRDMVSATLPCGRGWRGRSISVVGNGRSRELFDALELAR